MFNLEYMEDRDLGRNIGLGKKGLKGGRIVAPRRYER